MAYITSQLTFEIFSLFGVNNILVVKNAPKLYHLSPNHGLVSKQSHERKLKEEISKQSLEKKFKEEILTVVLWRSQSLCRKNGKFTPVDEQAGAEWLVRAHCYLQNNPSLD